MNFYKDMFYILARGHTTINNASSNRLRIFNSGNWNEDTVDCDTIIAFSAIEDYVNNNSPSWKKSPLYSIGMALSEEWDEL